MDDFNRTFKNQIKLINCWMDEKRLKKVVSPFYPYSFLYFSFERFIHVFSEARNDVDELNCTIETHAELMQRKSTHAMQWYFENFAEFFTFLWIQAPLTFFSTQGNSHLFQDFELTLFFAACVCKCQDYILWMCIPYFDSW